MPRVTPAGLVAVSATANYSAASARIPLFQERISAAPSGAGGISCNINSMKLVSASSLKAALYSRSKPIVENGFPLNRRPQTEPA